MVAGLVGGVGDGEDLALGAGEAVAALLHAGYVHIVNRWHSSSSQYLVYKLTNNIHIKYSWGPWLYRLSRAQELKQ